MDIKSAFTDVLRELDIEDDFVAIINELLAKVDEAKSPTRDEKTLGANTEVVDSSVIFITFNPLSSGA